MPLTDRTDPILPALASAISGAIFLAVVANASFMTAAHVDPGDAVWVVLKFGFFGCPPIALVFAYLARWHCRKGEASALTLFLVRVGALGGWFGTALIVTLSLTAAWQQPTSSCGPSCRSNLKQIGLALGMYQLDYQDELPPRLQTLVDLGYLKSTDILKSPCDTSGVAINARYVDVTSSYRYARVKKPTSTEDAPPIMWDRAMHQGTDGAVVLFYDLHVEWVLLPKLQAMVDRNRALYDKRPVMPREP